MLTTDFVAVASLLIAALAVFVGPLLSWHISKRGLAASERIAQRQMLVPIRQSWFAELRTKLAEMIALTLHYWSAGFDDRSDSEYMRLTVLEQQIKLLLDPRDTTHQQVVVAMRETIEAIPGSGPKGHDRFGAAHERLEKNARELVREEWLRLLDVQSMNSSALPKNLDPHNA